jgi:hypothetical protein
MYYGLEMVDSPIEMKVLKPFFFLIEFLKKYYYPKFRIS